MQSTERKILKKHYRKNLDIIEKIQEYIYNADEYADEYADKIKKEISSCYKVKNEDYYKLNFYFDIGTLDCNLYDSESYKKAKDEVKLALETEFNDERLSMTLEHCGDYVWNDILETFKTENIKMEYTDQVYNGTGIKVTIDYAELEDIADYDLDTIRQLKNYRESRLEGAVEEQRRLLKDFRLFKNQLKAKINKMKQLVTEAKSNIKYCGQNQLEYDIESYLEENQHIIEKNVEKIKFDYIAEIKEGKIITNKKAVVDFAKAKDLLKKFLAGENIIGELIGNFTILKVFDIKNIVFIRIGCHLIKIDKNLINQLS